MSHQFPNPPRPQPLQPQPTQVQAPMVYVYEPQTWEYKVVARKIAAEGPLSQEELNALGMEGWELAAAATLPEELWFYFKRVRK
jgi:hypothetical protein